MSKIKFLDIKDDSINTFNTNNPFQKINGLLESAETVEDFVQNNSTNPINQLHSMLLNSLNFQAQNNVFPSTLPSEINIKFTQKNTWEVLKKKAKDFWTGYDSQDIAKAGINSNTIFISTEFLAPPTDPFLKEFF